MAYETIVAGILSLLLILLVKNAPRRSFSTTNARFPPGPMGLPMVGNLFNMVGDVYMQCEMYQKWCRDLETDILYLNVLGTPMIVLNSYEASVEMLVNRSAENSGRLQLPMIVDLMDWGSHFGFMDYGETWRRHRKIMHQQFNTTEADEYEPQITKATQRLMKRLLHGTDDVLKEVRQMSGEIILSITYGIVVRSPNDPHVKAAEIGVQSIIEASLPGAYLVNTIPVLKHVPAWFPGAGFKRKALQWRKAIREMVELPFGEAKQAFREGTANPSLVAKYLDDIKKGSDNTIDEEDVKSVAGTAYQAGSDTLAVTITSCILALLDHPLALKKAQEEIDSVISHGRLPDLSDRDSLPYTTAVIKEVLRWKVILPISSPHSSSTDAIYKGYHIPAGSILIPNLWAIYRDEDIFPDPNSFIPERFLRNNENAEFRVDLAWGFGRRACAGRHLAESSVWLTLASIISVYDISKAPDEIGNITLNLTHTNSIVPVPSPIKAVFTPRDKMAEDLINNL